MELSPSANRVFSLRKYLISGSAWAFGGAVSALATGLFSNWLLARLLDPEALGVYFLVYSLVSSAAIFGRMGLPQAATRLIAESMDMGRPGRARSVVYAVLRFGVLSTSIVALFLGLGPGHWVAWNVFCSPLMARMMGLAAIWAVGIIFQSLLAEVFRGFRDIRLATIFNNSLTAALAVSSLALLWITKSHSDLALTLTVSVISSTISVLLGSWLLIGKVRRLKGASEAVSGEVWVIARPLLFTNVMLFVLPQAALWILGAFRPQEEVAIYGAATRLVTFLAMPLSVANAVVSPLIAGMYAQDRKRELERMLQFTTLVAGIPAFAVLAVYILFGGHILALMYGEYYRSGSVVLRILSVGQLVFAGTGPCGLLLVMTGHQRATLVITMFTSLMAIALAMLVVRQFGMLGVALAFTAGSAFSNMAMTVYGVKMVGVRSYLGFPSGSPGIRGIMCHANVLLGKVFPSR